MHPRTLWIILGGLVAFAAPAAVIYKWVDADGVTHYSDQTVPGAEKIYTTSSPSSVRAAPRPAGPASAQAPRQAAGLNFTQFAITSPTKDQTFFGDETVSVSLLLMPPLSPDQFVTWQLNGKQITDHGPSAISFTLQGLDRGAYSLVATVTDQRSGESQSTESINFFIRQPSSLSPQHKTP
jgi:Domain of unknown function (DUF4124)